MLWEVSIDKEVALILVSVASVLLLLIWRKLQLKPEEVSKFPRCPPGLPLFGNAMLLKRGAHQVLGDLAWNQGYGDLIGLWLGSIPTVVVSSADLAKEVLHTKDKILANRGRYQFIDDLYYGFNSGPALSSYNPRWVWSRKILTVELLTVKRLRQLQHIRYSELRRLLKRLQDSSNGGTTPVPVGQHASEMTANTALLVLQSKLPENAIMSPVELVDILEEGAMPSIGDFIPWLSCLDFFNSRRRRRHHERIDALMDSILEERRKEMAQCLHEELPHDFLQVLLSKEGPMDEEHLTTTEIKAIILDLFGGGVHTSSATLEWAMVELLRHPECMARHQKEVDIVMAQRCNDLNTVDDLVVDDDHVQQMPYLQSTVKEVMRLHPILPLIFPRVASTSFRLGKYELPAGTNVLVNAWAIARDPRYWERPTEFWPDRFLHSDVDFFGQHYEFLPFGSGRRMCPGIRLGLSVVQVTLANLLLHFDWEIPDGKSAKDIDMSCKGGLANSKAEPLLAIPKRRKF